MMYGTVRIKSLVWFATGVVVSLLATVIVMQAWRADAAPGDLDSTFVPITPCRLVDTRQPGQTLWTHGETRTVDAHGTNFECTLPSEAVGLSMNVTALDATTVGTFLTIWPDGQLQPNASSLNPSPGQPPTPNAVTTPVSSAGKFNVFNFSGTVGLIIDVNGYYTKATLQEIAMQLADKADRSDVYTKAEIDAALDALRTIPINLSNDGGFDDEIVVIPGFGEIGLSCSGPELTVVWKNTSGEVETIGGPDDNTSMVDVAAGAQVFRPDLDLDGTDLGYVLMSVRRASGPVASIVGWAETQGSDCVLQAQGITS